MAFTNAQGRTQTSLSDINVTPFVDVLLVLLIIFMLTAPILQSGIEVDVPRTRTVREISQERLVVSIDRGERLYLGNDAVNIHELGPKLKEKIGKGQDQSVFLRADQRVPFGTVALVVDELRQSGIEQISMVTEPLTGSR
jgi:biopolymer transport protein ExbD/biopolymer transport protein TolR